MKVKIVKCSSKHYWYKEKIGHIFTVNGQLYGYGGFINNDDLSDSYQCVDKGYEMHGIRNDDCVIVKEEGI